MTGEERRNEIHKLIKDRKSPLSGAELAKILGVSRQVIVQDIALLRANGDKIYSTNKGYIIEEKTTKEKVFKVIHRDEDVEKELSAIVDMGGHIKDVFVNHKVYGIIRVNLNIKSRLDVKNYLNQIESGKSSFLKNVTSEYHYHTVAADSDEIFESIHDKLKELGFLAELREEHNEKFY